MQLSSIPDVMNARRIFRSLLHPKREPTLVLTEDQCDFFWRNGYLAVPSITTPDELETIRRIYDRLFEDRAGWEDGNYFDFAGFSDKDADFKVPQLQMMTNYAPELFETLYYANAEAASRQLLGHRAKHLFDHGIRKPARTGGETPWHQDIAFLDGNSYFESLTVWMPLQAVDAVNGCMSFVPGSHLGPVVEHRSPGGDNRVNGLEAVSPDVSQAVSCPLPAGGATFHHFGTLHYAGANRSDQPRRVLSWGFGIRRTEPVVTGTFPWIAAKDNERLHRWNSNRVLQRAKQAVVTHLNRFLT